MENKSQLKILTNPSPWLSNLNQQTPPKAPELLYTSHYIQSLKQYVYRVLTPSEVTALRAKISFFNQFSAKFLKWPGFFSNFLFLQANVPNLLSQTKYLKISVEKWLKIWFSMCFWRKSLRKSLNKNFALGCGRCLTYTLDTWISEGSENWKP